MTDWYDAWAAEYQTRFNLLAAAKTDWVNYVGTIDPTWASKINANMLYALSMFEHVKSAVYHFDQVAGGDALTKEEIFDLWLERAGELTL